MLPLKPQAKTPLTTHGLHDASTDPDQITEWWNRWEAANIGLRTGVAFDVLDVDGPAGTESLLEIAPGYRHDGPLSATGRGYHLLFAVTEAKNGANLRPKLDFRGQNGYIVAPPSIHPDGHQYVWRRPQHLALPAAPAWLVTLLFPPKPERVAPPRPASDAISSARGQLDLITELQRLGCEIQKKGGRLVTNCPFGNHRDSTPSLTIYNNGQDFTCFGCYSIPNRAMQGWGDALNVVHFQRFGTLR